MGFPRSLKTDKMALYYCREEAFPPRLLPFDYEELCSGFVLCEAEECAQDYKVPELPHVVFLAMLINDAVKLGILSGRIIGVMESALKELRWSTFQAWVGRNRGRILEAPRQKASSDSEEEESSGSDDQNPLYSDRKRERERERERERDRSSQRESWFTTLTRVLECLTSLCLLPEDYWELCPCFLLSEAKEIACDFKLPKMIQATFYAMLLNDDVELGIVSRFMDADLKVTLEVLDAHQQAQPSRGTTPRGARGPLNGREESSGSNDPPPPSSDKAERKNDNNKEREEEKENSIMFPNFLSTQQVAEYVRDSFNWSLRESSTLRPNLLPKNHHDLCPNFDLLVAMRYAHSSDIPKMIQAIFYAMVLNKAAGLGLSSRILWGIEDRISRAHIPHLVDLIAHPLACGPEEVSTLNDAPLASRAPERSDIQDGPSTHFPNPKVVSSLKRSALEEKFVLSEVDVTMNKPPAKCIAMYQAAFTYGVRLTSISCTFAQASSIQRAHKGPWVVLFNNKKGFMRAIEKKSKVKNQKYNFLFIRRKAGWGYLPNWNKRMPVRSPYGEPTKDKKRAARYFHFYAREDDRFSVGSDLTLLSRAEQARAKLSPLESGDGTIEQVATEVEKVLEEVRRKCVEAPAKKAPSLAPRSKNPIVGSLNLPHLVPRKHPRTKDGHDVAAAPTPTLLRVEAPPSKGKGLEGPAQKVSAVDEEHVAMAELKKEKGALAEKTDLERQLKEARSQAEAEAERVTKAKDKGYQLGYDQSIEFFRELLLTMVPEAFSVEGYFEAYVKYIEDCRRDRAEG
ncbi:hypothetical protein Cgig2_013732 [Carnegiea gigantea]|uniref:Uncharacterized protein n=1 Tax=Carnegiea gigantea TaxID=171969 RepID=A0A9Q1JWJ5_9CARY|nr:hypothetical protein Cgig2_013732 [Carnegiea gigantea]